MSGGGGKERVVMGLRGNALVVSMTEFFTTCGMFLTESFWSLYVLELGASITELGVFSLATGLVPALFVAPMGYLGDRVSRRKLIIVGGLISGFGPLINAFATNWVQLIPGTMLMNLFPVMRPVMQALLAEDIQPHERGKAYATVFTMLMLPDSFMPMVAGVILDNLGFEMGMRYLLLVSAGLRFLVAAVRLKFLKEKKRDAVAKIKIQFSLASARKTLAAMFKALFSIKMLPLMLIASTGLAFSMSLMMRFQSVYAVNIVGLTKTEWGIISGGVSIVRVVTRIPLGGLADKWGRRKCILINYCLQPLCIVAFPFSNDFFTTFGTMAARIVAFNIGGSAWEAMLVDLTPANVRGSVFGSMGMVELTTRSIAPTIGGAVWDALSPPWAFYVSALGQTFCTVILLMYLKEPEYREK